MNYGQSGRAGIEARARKGVAKSRCHPLRGSYLPSLILILLACLFGPSRSHAAQIRTSQIHNLSVSIYGDDQQTLVGVLKIERVSTEHRRVGFFRVKLMPILVAHGVRLELRDTTPWTNWISGFRATHLGPSARNRNVEYREVSVSFPSETKPRIAADSLRFNSDQDGGDCVLYNAQLATESDTVRVPAVHTCPGFPAGELVWDSNGKMHRWNLFSKSLTSLKSATIQEGKPQ